MDHHLACVLQNPSAITLAKRTGAQTSCKTRAIVISRVSPNTHQSLKRLRKDPSLAIIDDAVRQRPLGGVGPLKGMRLNVLSRANKLPHDVHEIRLATRSHRRCADSHSCGVHINRYGPVDCHRDARMTKFAPRSDGYGYSLLLPNAGTHNPETHEL